MEHARSGLQKVVMDAIRRAPKEEAPLLAWPVACGPKVSERTRALSFADGVLRVEVPDARWRAELLAFVPQYLAVLKQVANVGRIEFVISDAGVGRNAHTSKS